MGRMILGCIADDFTGATDLASMLVRSGMRTVQVIGVPEAGPLPDADAVVVALKSRTSPVGEAVRDSLRALHWLRNAGARQFYFKYCSTFDSTPTGNIGPVAEALLDELGGDFAVACPAFPENRRTVYQGHLFVGERLLHESGMRNHPLTPMTDSNLIRVLQAQCHGTVGLVPHDVVSKGVANIRSAFDALHAKTHRFAIVDAIDDDNLRDIAAACDGHPLITGASGIALGLPAVYQTKGWLEPDSKAAALPTVGGRAAVLSGSCSEATNGQVAHWISLGRPAFRVDAQLLAADVDVSSEALNWATRHGEESVLIYATAEPAQVKSIQDELGTARAGELVEQCLADIARELVQRNVRRLVVAGGETSGAVVKALGISQLRIGVTIDPGVPWTQAVGRPLLLALKSGNFGGADFFCKSLDLVS